MDQIRSWCIYIAEYIRKCPSLYNFRGIISEDAMDIFFYSPHFDEHYRLRVCRKHVYHSRRVVFESRHLVIINGIYSGVTRTKIERVCKTLFYRNTDTECTTLDIPKCTYRRLIDTTNPILYFNDDRPEELIVDINALSEVTSSTLEYRSSGTGPVSRLSIDLPSSSDNALSEEEEEEEEKDASTNVNPDEKKPPISPTANYIE